MARSRQKLYSSIKSILMNRIDPSKITDAEKQAQIDAMWRKHDESKTEEEWVEKYEEFGDEFSAGMGASPR